MPRLGGGQTATSYLVSGSTLGKRNSAPLPTTAEYIPAAPSSGNGRMELSSLMTSRPPSSFKGGGRNSSGGSMMSMVSPMLSPTPTTRSELPMSQNLATHSFTGDEAPRRATKKLLKASEGGTGSLLPDFAPSGATMGGGGGAPATPQAARIRREVPSRSKSSTASLLSMRGSRSSHTLPQTQQDVGGGSQSAPAKSSLSLRRRAGTATSDDEFDNNSVGSKPTRRDYRTDNDVYYNRRRSSANSSAGGVRGGGDGTCGAASRSSLFLQFSKISRVKLGHILQVVIVLAVTALVWESHHKALFAAQQLTQFKEEESLLLLHLQKIEQQSIQLHENLSRLARVGVAGKAPSDQDKNGGDAREVDFDLIHKQTQQLYQMEEELNHEVKTLQTRIQQSARNHIIQEFGEGPVQIILELDFGKTVEGAGDNAAVSSTGPNRIAILLWHDTPHAAWTWLEQIGRNIWDGADFQWTQGHIIDAVPHDPDPLGGKIEFVEQSQHGHEAWTIGVRESDNGAMGMYINLQDNTNLHKHETCVGKVIDGFDALQRLLEVARTQRYDKDSSSITIRKASAMHVTKKGGA